MGSKMGRVRSRTRQGAGPTPKERIAPATAASIEEQAQTAVRLAEAEKLQKALLNSISHNLRTPLASIIGALSTLQEDRYARTSTRRLSANWWTRRG